MVSPDVPEPDAGVSLSFVIPAHNSSAVIEDTLEAVAKRLADTSAEIIVVENGSTDDTRGILDRLSRAIAFSQTSKRINRRMDVPTQ